jgi:hypothetical protein
LGNWWLTSGRSVRRTKFGRSILNKKHEDHHGEPGSNSRQPPRWRIDRVLLGSGLFASVVSFVYPILSYLIPPPVADLGSDEVVASKVGD